ncbi:MAG: polysaccharide deacetylase family protein [Firmicutes bacterium]|nr:polysaccharide deacetylase family protein [Bacillota bacterium]
MNTLAVFILAVLGAAAVYAVGPTLWYKYGRRNTPLSGKQKQIILSFDDGPDPRYTPELLKILQTYQVKAAFFVLAEKAEKYPQLMQDIVAQGHLVGLHGWDHRQTLFASCRRLSRDLQRGLAALQKAGCHPRYYRPPHGYINLSLLLLLKKNRLHLLLWTVMAQDWQAATTDAQILDKLCRRCRPGSLICLHDSGEGSGGAPGAPQRTLAALRRFIPQMQEAGYRFVLPLP